MLLITDDITSFKCDNISSIINAQFFVCKMFNSPMVMLLRDRETILMVSLGTFPYYSYTRRGKVHMNQKCFTTLEQNLVRITFGNIDGGSF